MYSKIKALFKRKTSYIKIHYVLLIMLTAAETNDSLTISVLAAGMLIGGAEMSCAAGVQSLLECDGLTVMTAWCQLFCLPV